MLKNHSTIGCCGIDCGLCPRYYTRGTSACPGCGAVNFREKHPACGFLTCCVHKIESETCAQCDEFPCKRFENERKGYDSFVTHQKVFPNLQFIRENGIAVFLNQQNQRIEVLRYLLENFDDGRSKSFYCQACALIPVEKLTILLPEFQNKTMQFSEVRESISALAKSLNIELKLRRK